MVQYKAMIRLSDLQPCNVEEEKARFFEALDRGEDVHNPQFTYQKSVEKVERLLIR